MENVGAWIWNGMEQEDFGNVRVGKASECGRLWEMLEMSECGIGKHQSMENIRVWKTSENVRDIRVWNRKTSETSEREIGMEIWGRF